MDEGVDAARPRRDRMRERAVRLARWGRKVAAAIGHGTVMFAMALGQLPITVVVMVGVVLTYSLGMVFFFPPAIRLGRWWTGIARRRAEAWSGVRIEDPVPAAAPAAGARRPTACTGRAAPSTGRPGSRPGTAA